MKAIALILGLLASELANAAAVGACGNNVQIAQCWYYRQNCIYGATAADALVYDKLELLCDHETPLPPQSEPTQTVDPVTGPWTDYRYIWHCAQFGVYTHTATMFAYKFSGGVDIFEQSYSGDPTNCNQ